MPENVPPPPETPDPGPEPDPSGGSPSAPPIRVARWRRYLPLGDGNFTATAITAPVLVAVVVLAVTNGFGGRGQGRRGEDGRVPYRRQGLPHRGDRRTRLAWKQDLNTRQWSVTDFDESILR
ncbi:hypothetical protein ACH4VM_30155 [Streptomyces sp. NPDC020792]|uniref:hypothetical protein n=1 Tax=Streptomyces sp. NPDC020792 TaxID=3365089 RepID=UPI0037BCDF84